MKMTFKKPILEPKFQSDIYRTRIGEDIIYCVVIGKEGTEVPRIKGEFMDYYAISSFMDSKGIGEWVEKQTKELKKMGKRVEFDDSVSYVMACMIEELARESPITMPDGKQESEYRL